MEQPLLGLLGILFSSVVPFGLFYLILKLFPKSKK